METTDQPRRNFVLGDVVLLRLDARYRRVGTVTHILSPASIVVQWFDLETFHIRSATFPTSSAQLLRYVATELDSPGTLAYLRNNAVLVDEVSGVYTIPAAEDVQPDRGAARISDQGILGLLRPGADRFLMDDAADPVVSDYLRSILAWSGTVDSRNIHDTPGLTTYHRVHNQDYVVYNRTYIAEVVYPAGAPRRTPDVSQAVVEVEGAQATMAPAAVARMARDTGSVRQLQLQDIVQLPSGRVGCCVALGPNAHVRVWEDGEFINVVVPAEDITIVTTGAVADPGNNLPVIPISSGRAIQVLGNQHYAMPLSRPMGVGAHAVSDCVVYTIRAMGSSEGRAYISGQDSGTSYAVPAGALRYVTEPMPADKIRESDILFIGADDGQAYIEYHGCLVPIQGLILSDAPVPAPSWSSSPDEPSQAPTDDPAPDWVMPPPSGGIDRRFATGLVDILEEHGPGRVVRTPNGHVGVVLPPIPSPGMRTVRVWRDGGFHDETYWRREIPTLDVSLAHDVDPAALNAREARWGTPLFGYGPARVEANRVIVLTGRTAPITDDTLVFSEASGLFPASYVEPAEYSELLTWTSRACIVPDDVVRAEEGTRLFMHNGRSYARVDGYFVEATVPSTVEGPVAHRTTTTPVQGNPQPLSPATIWPLERDDLVFVNDRVYSVRTYDPQNPGYFTSSYLTRVSLNGAVHVSGTFVNRELGASVPRARIFAHEGGTTYWQLVGTPVIAQRVRPLREEPGDHVDVVQEFLRVAHELASLTGIDEPVARDFVRAMTTRGFAGFIASMVAAISVQGASGESGESDDAIHDLFDEEAY